MVVTGRLEHARQRMLFHKIGAVRATRTSSLPAQFDTAAKVRYGALAAYFWVKNGFVAPPVFTPIQPTILPPPAATLPTAAEVTATLDKCTQVFRIVKEKNPGKFIRFGLPLVLGITGAAVLPLTFAAASATGTLLLLAAITPVVGLGLALLATAGVTFARTYSLKQAQRALFATHPLGAAQLILHHQSQDLPCFKAFTYPVEEVRDIYRQLESISGKAEQNEYYPPALEAGMIKAKEDLRRLKELTGKLLFRDAPAANHAFDRIIRLESVIIPELELKMIHREIKSVCNKTEDSYHLPHPAYENNLSAAEADLDILQNGRGRLMALNKYDGTPEQTAVEARIQLLEKEVLPYYRALIQLRTEYETIDALTQKPEIDYYSDSDTANLRAAEADLSALRTALDRVQQLQQTVGKPLFPTLIAQAEARAKKLEEEIISVIRAALAEQAAAIMSAGAQPAFGEGTQMLPAVDPAPDDDSPAAREKHADEIITALDDPGAVEAVLGNLFRDPDQIPASRRDALLAKLDDLGSRYPDGDTFDSIDEVRNIFEGDIPEKEGNGNGQS